MAAKFFIKQINSKFNFDFKIPILDKNRPDHSKIQKSLHEQKDISKIKSTGCEIICL